MRTVVVNLGEPFEPFPVERGMLPLKFYHDFNCEVESYSYAFGPCWEPVIAQCNLSEYREERCVNKYFFENRLFSFFCKNSNVHKTGRF